MRFDDPHRPTPTRGIIIVDTSALLEMSALLSPELCIPEKNGAVAEVRLRDALLLLAQNGYEVVIPEMVSVEAGRIMHDGLSLDNYFGTLAKNRGAGGFSPLMADFLASIPYMGVLDYLPDARIRIEPAPPEADSDAANYMRALSAIHTGKFPAEVKRNMIIALHKEYHSRKHYGDQAAHDLIRHMDATDVPVFYLCNDRDASFNAAGIRQDVPVNRLSVPGLYEAVKNNGLLREIKMHTMAGKIVFADIDETLKPFSLKNLPRNYQRQLWDLPPGGEGGHKPFAESLAALKAERAAGRWTDAVAPAASWQGRGA